MAKEKNENAGEKESFLKFFNGLKMKTKLVLLALVMILLIILVVYLKMVVFNNKEGQVTTISKSSLEKVLEINELSTVEYTYNAIANVYDEKDKKGEKIKYYVAYEGFVSAGIDFKKIEIQVNEAEKVVTVVLPEIEVHSTTVEMGSLDCIFVKEKYNTEEVSKEAYAASKADLEKRIGEDHELLDLAKKNAIESVKALFAPWIEQVDEEYRVEVY